MTLYEYTSTNSTIISDLGLTHHLKGGYFKETHRSEEQVPSPFADDQLRPLSTTIYYLLTPDEPQAYFQRTKSPSMHVLNQGRAGYYVILPHSGSPVNYTVLGADSANGEERQLFVPGGAWKAVSIPDDDLSAPGIDKAKVGCLTSVVVTPGFIWEDHEWMTTEHLEDIFKGVPKGDEQIAKLATFIRPIDA